MTLIIVLRATLNSVITKLNAACRYTYEYSKVMIMLLKKQLAASNISDTKKLYIIFLKTLRYWFALGALRSALLFSMITSNI